MGIADLLSTGQQNAVPLRELVAHLLRQAQQNKENRGVSVFADLNPLD